MSDNSSKLLADIQSRVAKLPPSIVVRQGDSIWAIVERVYAPKTNAETQELVDFIARKNGVSNPSHIEPGWVLVLAPEERHGPPAPSESADAMAIRQANELVCSLPKPDREAFYVLHELVQTRPGQRIATNPAAGGIGMPTANNALSGIVGSFEVGVSMNQQTLGKLVGNYESYATGVIDKSTYNANRLAYRGKLMGMNRQAINLTAVEGKALRAQLKSTGSLNGAMFKQQTTSLVNLGKAAKVGGVVLSVVSLGVACNQIGAAKTSSKKNEIFVGEVTSQAVAVGAGLVVTSLLALTPVGWGMAIVLGVGAAAASYGAGEAAKVAYRHKGQELKFVENLGVTKVCKPS